jgi:hypothetical protein
MTRVVAVSMGIALLAGCAAGGPGGLSPLRVEFDPRLSFPVTASTPDPGTDAPAPRAEGPAEPDAREATQPRLDRVSRPLFWTGIVLGAVGTGMLAGFGIDGAVTERKIERGYENGFTRAERDRLEDRGGTDNVLAATGAATAAVGFAIALVMLGVDYSRCGPLAERRRRCNEP